MKRYLPSSKILVLAALLAVVVAGTFVWVHHSNTRKETPIVATEGESYIAPSEDSDSDGIANWMEVSLGTNPDTSDTDGDGTSDSSEISEGRDPLKPAPNDELAEGDTRFDLYMTVGGGAGENKTNEAFNAIFPSALVLADNKKNNKPVDASEYESIAQAAAATVVDPIHQYTISDLTIAPSVDTPYLQSLQQAIAKYDKENIDDEVAIIAKAITNNDAEELAKLQEHVELYTSLRDDLLKLPVTSSWSSLHLALINNITGIIAGLSQIQKLADDPLQGLIGINEYRQYTTANEQVFSEILARAK